MAFQQFMNGIFKDLCMGPLQCWSTLIILNNIRNTSVKFFADCESMGYMKKLKNANGTVTQLNSLDTWWLPKAWQWLITKSKSFLIGPNLGRLKTFSPSLALPTSIANLFTFIQTSQFLWQGLKAYNGISVKIANSHSTHLSRHLLQHPSIRSAV